jgi:hypothetical protein
MLGYRQFCDLAALNYSDGQFLGTDILAGLFVPVLMPLLSMLLYLRMRTLWR